MANMSYCRNENTYHDLLDCLENIYKKAGNERDERYRIRLIELLQDIELGSYDLDEALNATEEDEDEDLKDE